MNTIVSTPVLENKTSKGLKKFWQGHVCEKDGEYFTQTSYWQETANGESSVKQTSAPYKVVGKNIGKKNETTPEAQATFEMNAAAKKQIDKGYHVIGGKADILTLPMLAHVYADRKHTLILPASVQPKYDGCIHANTLLDTSDGKKTIEEIVKNKLDVSVLSFNEEKNHLEYKKIVNWFDNGLEHYAGWLDIKPSVGEKHIRCTPNHKFYTNCGWVEAKHLDENKHMIYVYDHSEYKNSLILGTLLGDSSLGVDKRGSGTSYRLVFGHTNKSLFDFKVELLGLDGEITDYISGYGSSGHRFVSKALTKTNFDVTRIYHTGHENQNIIDGVLGKRKFITYEYLSKNLSAEALSLWIADDGSLRLNNYNEHTPNLSISTHNHSHEQIDEFVKYFKRKWQCIPSTITDKRVDTSKGASGIFLQFSTKDTLYILNQLRQIHCRGVEYKYYFPTEGYITHPHDECRFVKFTRCNSRKMPPAIKYDIEVEDNHNYIANGIVIHNCRCLSLGDQKWSRQGKKFIPEVVAHLNFDTQGFTIDGELLLPAESGGFQDSMKAIKKYRPESHDLEYHVYDVVADMTFPERYELLQDLMKHAPAKVKLVSTYTVNTEEEIFQHQVEFTEAGYEGTMIRSHTGGYVVGQRSVQLLKLKDFMDAEYKITDVLEGGGKEVGCAIFVCETDGKPFNVRPKGTSEDRKEMFSNRKELIGKILTVAFQNLSEDGIPRFPVGIAVRDYE
jgi:hypothetical protein